MSNKRHRRSPWALLTAVVLLLSVGCAREVGPRPVANVATGESHRSTIMAAGWGSPTPNSITTTDQSNHTVTTLYTTAGHSYHLVIDWACIWTGTPANADGGKFDGTCTDSAGSVTCSSTAGTHQSLGIEGCNTPTVAAGTGDSITITVSASQTTTINWNVQAAVNVD